MMNNARRAAAEPSRLGMAFGSLGFTGQVEQPARAPKSASVVDSRLDVDWSTVVILRRQVSELITAAAEDWLAEHGTAMPDLDRKLMGRSLINTVVRAHAEHLSASGQAMWPLALEHRYVAAVENATFGYGRLQPLFEIPKAENIEIHGWDSVVIQYGDGHREKHPPVADSDEELIEAIRFLAENASPPRAFDDAHPVMTLALGDRYRLHAIGFGLSYRPSIIIRQHILTDIDLPKLAETSMMPIQVARLLHAAVLARKSIVISGDQGAGKTTLLRALIAAIPENERFGTLETDYELLTHLQPGRKNMLALQAKTGLGERHGEHRVGEYSVVDLFPEALRQNLSRLVVGEVRGTEAGAMFEAMQSGAGTLSTTHSHSALATIDRLASRVAQGGVFTIDEALRQVAHNIHLLVHVKLVDNTWCGGIRHRFVSEVRYLTGAVEANRPVTHLIYQADEKGQLKDFYPDAELAAQLQPFEFGWRAR